MKPYTVLLLYPDYVADNFGHDTFLAHVRASDPAQADDLARKDAVAATDGDPDYADEDNEESAQRLAADFHTLALFDGHLEDLKYLVNSGQTTLKES